LLIIIDQQKDEDFVLPPFFVSFLQITPHQYVCILGRITAAFRLTSVNQLKDSELIFT